MDEVGKKGEDAACRWLAAHGHQILGRNWRGGRVELDIISRDGDGLHFVEVKSRKAPTTADPEVNITPVKQRHLVQAARKYLHTGRNFAGDEELFFDVITVILDGETTYIKYYPQAFIPIYV